MKNVFLCKNIYILYFFLRFRLQTFNARDICIRLNFKIWDKFITKTYYAKFCADKSKTFLFKNVEVSKWNPNIYLFKKKHETNIIQHLLAYLCGFNKSPNNLLRCKRNRSVLVKENFAFLTGKGNCGILKITERYTDIQRRR